MQVTLVPQIELVLNEEICIAEEAVEGWVDPDRKMPPPPAATLTIDNQINLSTSFPAPGYDIDEILLEDTSDILTNEDVKQLSLEVPKRLLCCSWKKEFTTARDGFSLGSIYRRLHDYITRPALLAIKDMNGYTFGAYASEAFRIEKISYGCGETFVFSLRPSFRVWKWTCKNNFFILCSKAELCIGIEDGKFAIYLDESLYNGRTQACATFDNEPLTPSGDFQAAALEVWIFE